MEVLVRIVMGVLLIAHGLVHLLWFAPNVDPAWPFRIDRTWLLSEEARRPVAVVLVALIVAGFTMLGIAVWGVPVLAAIWPVLAIGAAVASLAALVLFWDRQLRWGVAGDVALMVVALWRSRCGLRRQRHDDREENQHHQDEQETRVLVGPVIGERLRVRFRA